MIFTRSLQSWGNSVFTSVVKQELEQLNGEQLKLQQGLQHSSYAVDDDLSIVVLNYSDNAQFIIVKAGVFYHGVIAGCNCADDPSPTDKNTEYCDIWLSINKSSAQGEIELLPG